MGGISTGLRSIQLLRKNGFVADNVERRNRFIANDFLGCIDLIGVRGEDKRIIGVQATSRSHRSTRIRKIMETEEVAERMRVWLTAGCELEVWSWGQNKGSRRWVLGRDIITLVTTGRTKGEMQVFRDDNGFV